MTGEHTTDPFDVGDALDRLDDDSDSSSGDPGAPDPTAHGAAEISLPSRESIASTVEAIWPAPGFRPHQKEAVVDVLDALYVQDKDVVTLSAPTGAGKSLIIYAAARVIAQHKRARSFITTPLNSLIDQIEADDYIDQVTTIKGKNNYQCTHPADRGADVGDAICQRDSNFHCNLKEKYDTDGGCPYYGRKQRAQDGDIAVTNLSYLMANSMIPEDVDARFEPRNLLAIDETQNIESFALNFIGFTIDRREIPINFKHVGPLPEPGCEMDEMAAWLRAVLREISDRLMDLQQAGTLTEEQNRDQDALQQLQHRISNFLEDYAQGRHWTKTRDGTTVTFEPVFIDRFIDRFLWAQSNKVLLSSATIPKGSFREAIGLEDKSHKHVTVPSTFDAGRRPVLTRHMVGKMTRGEREQTIPDMAETLAKIADFHQGENGFVHCHSYNIMESLYEELPMYVQRRTLRQDPDDRMGSLQQWMDSSHQVFLSVSMDEGISLDDDTARWQALAKASYPFLGDERVNYRVNEMGDWEWYRGRAAINLQQAVGRGMRSQDDWCVTYLLDKSFRDLLSHQSLFEPWFLESVNTSTPLETYSDPDSKFTFTA